MKQSKAEAMRLVQLGAAVRHARFRKYGKVRSITALSKDCGVTGTMISRIEAGTVNPSILVIERICAALEVEVADVL